MAHSRLPVHIPNKNKMKYIYFSKLSKSRIFPKILDKTSKMIFIHCSLLALPDRVDDHASLSRAILGFFEQSKYFSLSLSFNQFPRCIFFLLLSLLLLFPVVKG